MIFRKALEVGILKKNPTEFTHVSKNLKTIKDLEGRKDLPKYLEKQELKQFLQIADKLGLEQDYPIFLLLSLPDCGLMNYVP